MRYRFVFKRLLSSAVEINVKDCLQFVVLPHKRLHNFVSGKTSSVGTPHNMLKTKWIKESVTKEIGSFYILSIHGNLKQVIITYTRLFFASLVRASKQ